MKRGKRTVLSIVLTLLAGFLYFYFALPAINLQDPAFYGFFFTMAAVYCGLSLLLGGSTVFRGNVSVSEIFREIKRVALIPAICCLALIVIYLVGSLFSSPIFRARSFSEILTIEHSVFEEDVREISWDQIPTLDAVSAQRLGNRTLGELVDVVSQFEVAEQYHQINFQGRPVRVAPLVYVDIIRWFNNTRDGIPGFVIVDMVTQQAEVVRLEPGQYMRYSPSEFFFRYLQRHLRFQFPTFMFGEPVFELDDDANPYWVVPRIAKRIGLFGGVDIQGAVLTNAITGESRYYDLADIPTWVDRVFAANLLLQQYDWLGAYSNGFINSILGQRDVTRTTAGFNYIVIDDDVYMYTGITSVGRDNSIVGILLVNQRTRDATFYAVAGADERAGMLSAEGLVQDLRYVATFPLLLNIADQPTYFIALKDSTDIVRQFALVNVAQSQIAVNTTTIEEAVRLYREALLRQNIIHTEQIEGTYQRGVIDEIRTVVIEGDTHFFIRLRGQDIFYVITAAVDPTVVLLDVGDRVEIYHAGAGTDLISAHRIVRP
ncbi:MAG: CvpA family protein [Oscillospiraceae bacterium]|nr:CvpA family protein [Oscillospiraceae bacterium]